VHVAGVLVETEQHILFAHSAAAKRFATVSLLWERWYGWPGASYQVGRHGEVSLSHTVRDSVHSAESSMERVVRRGARSTGPSGGVAQSTFNGTLRAAVSDVSEDTFSAVERVKAGRCEACSVKGGTLALARCVGRRGWWVTD